jgi:hypothetical protein
MGLASMQLVPCYIFLSQKQNKTKQNLVTLILCSFFSELVIVHACRLVVESG